jgi:hypothetical protein
MTYEGLGEMFEGDSGDTCAGQFPLVAMVDRAKGLACAGPGARTPIVVSGICIGFSRYKYEHKSYYDKGLLALIRIGLEFIPRLLRQNCC